MLPGVLLEEDSILTLGENEEQRLMVSLAKFMDRDAIYFHKPRPK